MRRLIVPLAVVVLLLIGFAVTGANVDTVAQDATPAATEGHPVIGSWLADTDINSPDNNPSLIIFHDDGTFLELEEGMSDGIGAWEATGPNTALLTILFPNVDENGVFTGHAKVRVAVEVDESGDTFTADYTIEFLGADGSSTGELGPATAMGERIVAEEMGEPVAPLMEPEGTPTGTPAA
jgi:hypothetical protein